MEKGSLRELMGECNFKEKIVLKTFKKVFVKVYHFSRIQIINSLL